MKTCLIISYIFPPDGGGGAQRMAKLSKYMTDWNIKVLTRPCRSSHFPTDESLEKETHALEVIRVAPVASAGSFGNMGRIDCDEDWMEAARIKCDELLSAGDIDVVLITMSPFALAHLGDWIKENHQVALVYDLCDPWVLDGWWVQPNYLAWRKVLGRMKRALPVADGIIANTPESLKALSSAVNDITKICWIPMGFDSGEFDGKPVPAAVEKDKFLLVHSGTVYNHYLEWYRGFLGKIKRLLHFRAEKMNPVGRTEIPLLAAINILKTRDQELFDKLEVIFVGASSAAEAMQKRIDDAGLKEKVKYLGYVPHEEAVGWIQKASALFLPLHGLVAGERSLIVPGKTYEYIATQKPILAALPEGDARELVQKYSDCAVADPVKPEEIARAIVELSQVKQDPQIMAERFVEIEKHFSWRAHAVKFSAFFNEITA